MTDSDKTSTLKNTKRLFRTVNIIFIITWISRIVLGKSGCNESILGTLWTTCIVLFVLDMISGIIEICNEKKDTDKTEKYSLLSSNTFQFMLISVILIVVMLCM